MDIIFIDDLRVETLIGIYPREKAVPQTIEISLRIGASTASAGASDDIRDTIDYAALQSLSATSTTLGCSTRTMSCGCTPTR